MENTKTKSAGGILDCGRGEVEIEACDQHEAEKKIRAMDAKELITGLDLRSGIRVDKLDYHPTQYRPQSTERMTENTERELSMIDKWRHDKDAVCISVVQST